VSAITPMQAVRHRAFSNIGEPVGHWHNREQNVALATVSRFPEAAASNNPSRIGDGVTPIPTSWGACCWKTDKTCHYQIPPPPNRRNTLVLRPLLKSPK